MSAPQPLLKIGEFARRAGVSLRTLRYYEELDLLRPTARTRGRFRCYREADLDRLHLIQSFQQLGLRLDRIAELLALPDPEHDRRGFLTKVRAALLEQEALVQQEIGRLQAEAEHLATARSKLGECEHCERVPTRENNHCEPCGLTGLPLPESLRALY